jgi:hypothetical protein
VSKMFGLILLVISLYIGMSVYGKVVDQTLTGVFAPIESSSHREDSPATYLTPGAQLAEEPSAPTRPRVRITEQVRQRVTADLDRGASRRGYESR